MGYLKILFKLIFDKDVRNCFFRFIKALKYRSRDRDYDKAINELSAILENKACAPIEFSVYEHLGITYFYKGSYYEAENALRKALELSLKKQGHDSHLYQYLAYTYMKLGKFESALMFFEKAACFGPEGYFNKHLTDIEDVNEMKKSLEQHKDKLPFMTAYFEQNKERFSKQDKSKSQ